MVYGKERETPSGDDGRRRAADALVIARVLVVI